MERPADSGDDRGVLFPEEEEFEYDDPDEAAWLAGEDEGDWDEDDFTQAGGSDLGLARAGPGWARGPELAAEAFASDPSAWGGGLRGLPVVETLLSRKPRKGAVAAVAWTLGVLLVVSSLYWWGPRELADALPASGETVFVRGETWRLFTAMGAHADGIHLLSNTVFLSCFIYFSYGAFGPTLFPWTAVPVAALSLAVTLEGYAPNIRIVGASGLLYLLAGTWLTLYVLVERRLTIPKRLLRAVGVFLVVLVPTSIEPEVSYRAHGIGFFFGICLALAYFLARRETIRGAERRGAPEE